MRIISKFRDFYDSAAGYGVDPTLVYVREESVVHVPHVGSYENPQEFDIPRDVTFQADTKPYKTEFRAKFILIGFCGQLYPVVAVQTGVFDPQVEHVFYGYQDFFDFWDEASAHARRYRDSYTREGIRNFFTTYGERKTDEPFVKYRTPVFAVSRHAEIYRDLNVTINPLLSKYRFFSLVDAFSAFQQIAQYLSNQLAEEKKVDTIEDKYRIGQHGFDKYSFRHPTKLKDLK